MKEVNIRISFIVPLYNEELAFDELVTRLSKLSETLQLTHEIILVDDGSTDRTPDKMESLAMNDHRYQCIFLSRNFGHQFAVSAGLKYSRALEAVMILDGDLQDPPEMFPDFYKKLTEGYDVVYGVRTKRKESIFKRASYYLFYRILKKISLIPIHLDSGDFSLLSRRVVDIMNSMQEDSRFLRGMRSWVGFKQVGIPYDRDDRVAGTPKYTIKKLMKLAYDGIFNFSFFPLKFLTFTGVFCLFSSFAYFVITVTRKYLYNDVPVGFTALLFMIIFFGGVQLLSIGVLGEYVFRIFIQVKNRPLFIIRDRIQEGKRTA